jgi:predicted DNA-binding ribbon-helix-helix protein
MNHLLTEKPISTSIYEQDYCLWIEDVINQLKDNNLNPLDLINLIAELDNMGRSEKNALESNLRILLLHLLKYKYQPDLRSKSWLFSIMEHRLRINKAFRNSPSLKRYFSEVFEESYQDACKLAVAETGLAQDTFPSLCPFTQEEVLAEQFLPISYTSN